MRQPLSDFAARLVRNGEVSEFLTGLVLEHEYPLEELASIVEAMRAGRAIGSLIASHNRRADADRPDFIAQQR